MILGQFQMTSLTKVILLLAVFFMFESVSPKTYAGYSITDKDGKVISEEPGNTLVTGPTNQTIILNDWGNRKVFEIFWDANGSAVIVKGDNVHLKINSNGNIDKWTPLENDYKDQYPVIIQPVVPRSPRSK